MMVFFMIFSSFLAAVYAYTGFRLIPSLVPKGYRFMAWILLFCCLGLLMAHIYLRVTFQFPRLSDLFGWIGYTALGAISYLACLCIFRDFVIILSLSAVKIRQIFSRPKSLSVFNPQRRQFLFKSSSVAIAAASGTAVGTGFVKALKTPEVIHVPIRLNRKHQALSGLTIAQFCDLHVGPTVQYPYVKQVCDTIERLNPDLIVFTGDLADGSPGHLDHDVSPLGDLKAPLGKYFVTGNHEYYSGVNRWLRKADTLGFVPLINEHRVLSSHKGLLTLGGVTDIRAGAFFNSHNSSPKKAFAGSPQDSFKLLLAHQPTSIYEAANLGVDLQLSGHTHGGQYFPFGWFVLLEHPFIKGIYKHKNTQLYVSQGTGYWGPPLRIGTFPEITLFTLT